MGDHVRLHLQRLFQIFARPFGGGLVSGGFRVGKAAVFFGGELAVDGQQGAFALARRQEHRIFHHGVLVGVQMHVGAVLRRGKHLRQQRLQLHLAPGAAQLHVGEHLFDVRHAPRQLLHLADALIHRFQPLVDDGITLLQPVFEGGRELFVHSFAHFGEGGGVLLVHVPHLARHRPLQLGQPPLGGGVQRFQPRRHGLQVAALPLGDEFQPVAHIVRALRRRIVGAKDQLFQARKVGSDGAFIPPARAHQQNGKAYAR